MRFGPLELILFLAVLLFPAGSYYFSFRPQAAKMAVDQAEIALKRETLDKLRAETSRTDDLVRENAMIAERIDEIESRLPTNKEIDQIVRQVSDLAVEAGLALPTFSSEKPIRAARFMEQPLTMETEGSFAGYYAFMVSVERLPRITRLIDMTIKRGKEDEAEIAVEFTLSIYFREDEGSAS